MASLRVSNIVCSSAPSSSGRERGIVRATMNMPSIRNGSLSLPKLQARGVVEELQLRGGYRNKNNSPKDRSSTKFSDPMVIEKLYAIMEAVSDRIEMHKNVEEQRNNWNSLLLTSINAMTLTAATMTGIAASGSDGAPLVALGLSSTLLYLAATGMLVIMNKIQPSQLAEEQRNASRLFKQLHQEINTKVSIGNPNNNDVKVAMEKVLALDRAYPLPLIGVMLEKFPESVKPAVWWPKQQERKARREGSNGWDGKLEERMKQIANVMERNDKEDYLRLGEKAVKLNKMLAISGPLLTGLAAVGSAFAASPSHGSWAVVLGVVGGALASSVNTLEHGGQVGMVFEMYRSNAGFFQLMEESIESNLNEDAERRENGELFEMKMAMKLGRSLSGLKDLAETSSIKGEAMTEFASKLF